MVLRTPAQVSTFMRQRAKRDVCGQWFIWCWSVRSEPVAVFSEPPFWSLVGGRVVKINWIKSVRE